MKKYLLAFLLLVGITALLPAQQDRAKQAFKWAEMALSRKQYNRAIDYYSRDTKGDYLEAYFKRGLASHSAEKYEDAVKDFDKCIDNNYNVDEAKKYKELDAGKQTKTVQTDYGSGVQSKYLAKQFYDMGLQEYINENTEKALSYYRSAVKMDPSYADAYAFISMINVHLKNYEEVIKACNQALEVKDNLKDGRLSDIYFNRGYAYWSLEKYDVALNDLNEAIKLNPSSGAYYTIRGCVKYALDDLESACKDWAAAQETGDPTDAAKLMEKYCN
jgi:tetratricopeptide (TPR) repeat protein